MDRLHHRPQLPRRPPRGAGGAGRWSRAGARHERRALGSGFHEIKERLDALPRFTGPVDLEIGDSVTACSWVDGPDGAESDLHRAAGGGDLWQSRAGRCSTGADDLLEFSMRAPAEAPTSSVEVLTRLW